MFAVKPDKMEELIELLIDTHLPLCDTEWWELFDQTQLTEEEKEFFFRHRT
jgi:hypothetical protein